jgi:choline dehydrogenase-like flavoprotein
MGDSPEKSVVDRNLRVHESPNLYVLGSSVFVTGGASHPTVAITALAHRLGEHLTTVTKEGTVEMDRVPESEPHIMAAI